MTPAGRPGQGTGRHSRGCVGARGQSPEVGNQQGGRLRKTQLNAIKKSERHRLLHHTVHKIRMRMRASRHSFGKIAMAARPQPCGRSLTQVTGATHSMATFCSIGVAALTEISVTSPGLLPGSTIFTSCRPSFVCTTHSRP